MVSRLLYVVLVVASVCTDLSSEAFQLLPGSAKASNSLQIRRDITCQAARRDVVASVVGGMCSLVLSPTLPAVAEDEVDLTSTLYNSDGSVKESVESEAKQRLIEFSWDASDQLAMSQDGVSIGETKSGSQVRLSYECPTKWSDGKGGDEIYFDRSEGVNAKACKRITVYQAPGIFDIKNLEKATTIGVAKALNVPEGLESLYKADVVSGRVAKRNDQTYYEFDMAAAPDICGDSKDNLGFGFCPYDNIYLMSATIVQDRLYCIVVECDSTKMWKLASSELKRTRSTFIANEV
jgi:hypothetical protein